MQRVNQCANCNVWTDTNWFPTAYIEKYAEPKGTTRIPVYVLDSTPPTHVYCSEECRALDEN